MPDPIVLLAERAFDLVLGTALGRLQKRRLTEARQILAKRLRRGEGWAVHEDDAASAIWTYLRAAEEGAARLNLELVAEAFANEMHEGTFSPDEFRRHALQLAGLSRDEALLLGKFVRVMDVDSEHENPWLRLKALVVGPEKMFPNGAALAQASASLLRTGYVYPVSLFGEMGFFPTDDCKAIRRMVDIDEVVASSL